MDDRWKHRSDRMQCKTCMWFVPNLVINRPMVLGKLGPRNLGPGEIVEMEETKLQEAYVIGRCRKRAPTMTGYPVVFEDDWCGDHKIDENK